MSQHGRFQSGMASTPRLLGGPPPAVGTISSAAGTMGVMTPNFNRGNKRGPLGGAASSVMGSITKLARSATIDGPEVTQTHDMPENQPLVVKRKLAQNDQIYSQTSNLQYFPIWVHPSVDEYEPSTDYSGEGDGGGHGYRGRLLVDTRHGIEYHSMTHTQKSIGGRTSFLEWHVSMAEMNFILQSQEPASDPKVGDLDFTEAMGSWKFDGVVNNKKANLDKYGKWNRTGDDAHVTVDQYNLSHVVNYWGREAVKGVPLFFIFKRVERKTLPLKPNRYVMGVNKCMEDSAIPEVTIDRDDIVGADQLGLTRKPFQIIPWARRGHDQPPLSELEYKDNFGISRLAPYRRVGTVHTGSSRTTRREYYNRASYDDAAAMRLPRIWIFLGV
ncbi:MAG: hypothetical protein ACTSUE_16460 [Promethearchaeota archaeon]